MQQRIIISIVWILLIGLIIFVLPAWIFTAVVTMITALAMFEFFNMIQKKSLPVYRYFGIAVGCLLPISTYFKFEPAQGWELLLITTLCLSVFLLQFTRRRTDNATSGIAITMFAVFYISWFFSFLVKIRTSDLIVPDGRMMVLFLLIVTKSGDMGAYFFGKYIGVHLLIPRISPKKSIEGAVGGFLCSFLAAFLCAPLIPQIELMHISILGILLGILGQIGDLSESLIKRDCVVKDSSTIFGNLGGMLDLVDSLLFTSPIFYFYMKFLS
ncbi:MAG: phosphatidate cytidylyltransferase [Candidatus Omnitrophica bacterium]|nr:phosphatidate cytidylyltransferase [Candidatus Omnitrophota bacterium]